MQNPTNVPDEAMSQMKPPGESTECGHLMLAALPTIEDVVAFVCRRRRCSADEAEEFRSCVHVRLLEDDCAVLRRFGGQSSLKTYLSVVIQRLFLDFRRQRWGVWRPSAEAKRLGETAVRLDVLVHRDGLSLEEAIETIRHNEGAAATPGELRALAARLPEHRPRRTEGEDALPVADTGAADAVEAPALAEQRTKRARELRRALREALGPLPAEDALVLRMRFLDGFTMARIAELLRLPPKPLYRRLERLLFDLRKQLQRSGFGPGDFPDVVGNPVFDLEQDDVLGERSAGSV